MAYRLNRHQAIAANVLFDVVSYQLQAGHEIDRFGDVGVHTGVKASLFILFECMGRHGNDRNMAAAGALFLSYGDGSLEAVHARHLHVHQNQVIVPILPHFYHLLSVLCKVA